MNLNMIINFLEKIDNFKTDYYFLIDNKKKLSSEISKFFSILFFMILILSLIERKNEYFNANNF